MTPPSARVLGGRYRIDQRLGEGGFGVVFEAHDRELDRRVAIKILDPAKAAQSPKQVHQLRDRFHREAVATAAVTHPNVVTFYDVGVDGDEVYIVMELLLGRPLDVELERWPTGMPAHRALPLFMGALEGLAVGHDAGIVHKDLKPQNLFLDRADSDGALIRIIDFGVARLLHEAKLTATGKLVGTPRYLAPEYIEHFEVTPALDVYQMGLILVEVLSAMPCVPRRLDLVTCCQRHVDGSLAIPDGLRVGPVGEVIARAVARNAADRYPSAREFAEALAAIDPSSVSTAAPGQHVPTPRLGVSTLKLGATQPMHGGAKAAGRATPRAGAPSAPRPRDRPTGPTKRLGSPRSVAEQLSRIAIEEPITAPRAYEPTIDTVSADYDPLRARRWSIYALVVIATIAAAGTGAFFAFTVP